MSNIIDTLIAYEVVDDQGFHINNALLKILHISRKHLTSGGKRELTLMLKKYVRVQRDGDVIVMWDLYDNLAEFYGWSGWMLTEAVAEYENSLVGELEDTQ